MGIDVNFLRQQGYDVTGYDPHYAPEIPSGKFDTVVCLYVLNVLLPEEQSHVLMAVSELLRPTGCAYFAVRRDIQFDGFRRHVKHQTNVYQCNVTLPYPSILRTAHCEIYGYRHYNQLPSTTPCPFCAPASNSELLTEFASAYAILGSPCSTSGHALIVPKKHVSYIDLSPHDRNACWQVVDRVKMLLSDRFRPAGFRIKIGNGLNALCAGEHGCVHVIPWYTGGQGE